MRTLGGFGILTMLDDGGSALTELGATLKRDALGRRARRASRWQPWFWQSFGDSRSRSQTGKPAMDKAVGMGIFDYLAQHPDEAALFSESMVASTEPSRPPSPPPTTSDHRHDRRRRRRHGNMLAHILARDPQPKGALFDRPTSSPKRWRCCAPMAWPIA